MSSPTNCDNIFHQIKTQFASEIKNIDQSILNIIGNELTSIKNVGQEMVFSSGKKIRPLLVIISAYMLHYNDKNLFDLAAIIELIHIISILHDDVVDQAIIRRNKTSPNILYGNAQCVLIGDFLFAKTIKSLSNIKNQDIFNSVIDACIMLTSGEVSQLVNSYESQHSESQYFSIIHKKTAALFETACHAGSILASPKSPQYCQDLKGYGHHFGMAYQIIDDYLDYTASAEATGKSAYKDLYENKITLPIIYLLKETPNKKIENIILKILDKKEKTESDVNIIIDALYSSQSLQHCKKKAQEHLDQAHDQLRSCPNNSYKNLLLTLAQSAHLRST